MSNWFATEFVTCVDARGVDITQSVRTWNYKAPPEEVDVSEQPKPQTEKGSQANKS